MDYTKLFTAKNIFRDLEETEKDKVLKEIVDRLQAKKLIAEGAGKEIVSALLKREALGSTGIGNGIAIPHAKIKRLDKLVTALTVSEQGVEFGAIDGERVHIIFMILSPTDQSDEHLAVLKWISTMVRNADFCRFARAATSNAELMALIEEMGAAVK